MKSSKKVTSPNSFDDSSNERKSPTSPRVRPTPTPSTPRSPPPPPPTETSTTTTSFCCLGNFPGCFKLKNIVDVDNNQQMSTTKVDDFNKSTNIMPNNTGKLDVVAGEKNSIPKDRKLESSVNCNDENLLNNEEDNSFKSEHVIKSAMIIQRWYRRYQTRLEVKKQTAWKIYQSIEYSGEQDQLKLCDFFLTLMRNRALINLSNQHAQIKQTNNRKSSIFSASSDNLTDSLMEYGYMNETPSNQNTKLIQKVFVESKENEENVSKNALYKKFQVSSFKFGTFRSRKQSEIIIEKDYAGMELKFPINKQNFHDLVNNFKLHKPLHVKYVIQLLEETIKSMKTLKNINFISTSTKKQITVVGDLHGSLDDLLMIFYKNGFPSDDNPYLFNGDFVDRGLKSIEVSLIIFCGFLMSPSAVYINRGNHEDHVMNARYGFLKEISNKYNLFSWLPLASLIDGKIYVVHGGISDRTLIKDLCKIKRDKYVSILKPPIVDENGELSQNVNTNELMEWRQVLDALWSDPKSEPGVKANTFRGGGCCFGPDISESVMRKNNLELIIRSHECKQSGYEYTHNNKVLTIFSASNYYEYGSNNGAYAKISSKIKPIIVQFHIKKGVEVTKNLSIRERVNAIELSAINHLLEKFLAHKIKLLEEYKLKDTEYLGTISLNDWCSITGDVLNLKLPWRTLRPKLVKLNQNGLVIYESTFEGLSISNNQSENSVTESLYRNKEALEGIFRAIDKDHSGQISKDEFTDVCKLIIKHDPTAKFDDNSIQDLSNTMDLDKDGFINLNEFLEAFRLVSSKIEF